MKKKRIIRRVLLTNNTQKLADAVAAVLGTDAVHRGSDSDQGEPRLFVPSGVPDLDLVLDRKGRGWPAGRIVEVYGGEATAKTGLGYALIAEAQKMGGEAILYPAEGNFDEWLAVQYGVDLNRLILGDDETVEGVFESYYRAMQTTGKDGLLVAMIDSVAGLSTKAELEDGAIGRDRAAQVRALLLSKAFRKLGASVPRTNSILFCVNQVRDNPDVTFGQKSKPPGGRALKFYASIRLRLEALNKIRKTKQGKTYVAGFHLKITAEKNRLAKPYQTANIILDFEGGLLPEPEKKKEKAKKL